LIASLALAAAVAGHPAANRERRAPDVAATVVDASVAAPTVKDEMVAWVDGAGHATSTAIADVLAVPTNFQAFKAVPTPAPKPLPLPGIVLGGPAGGLPIPLLDGVNGPAPDATGPAPGAVLGPQGAGAAIGPVVEPVPASGVAAPAVDEISGPGISVPAPQPASAASPNSQKPGKGSNLFGISYAPYRANHQCKSLEDITDDLSRLAGKYSTLRIYGTDCDQVTNVVDAVKSTGMNLFLGIWDIKQVQAEANLIAKGVAGNWDLVKAISVGNELVNSGQASPAEVVGAVKQARQMLRARGYQGPVVTVDTFVATEAHPELCDVSDFCAINAHAFFDSTCEASRSGQWLANTVERVRSKLASPNQKIMVTETGWPVQGVANGMAIPSLQNQRAALGSIRSTFAKSADDVILFSAYNDGWKPRDMLTFMADPYFGIEGAVSRSDQ
jgi:exo-beta-1,3-glucanase (GH17 family)